MKSLCYIASCALVVGQLHAEGVIRRYQGTLGEDAVTLFIYQERIERTIPSESSITYYFQKSAAQKNRKQTSLLFKEWKGENMVIEEHAPSTVIEKPEPHLWNLTLKDKKLSGTIKLDPPLSLMAEEKYPAGIEKIGLSEFIDSPGDENARGLSKVILLEFKGENKALEKINASIRSEAMFALTEDIDNLGSHRSPEGTLSVSGEDLHKAVIAKTTKQSEDRNVQMSVKSCEERFVSISILVTSNVGGVAGGKYVNRYRTYDLKTGEELQVGEMCEKGYHKNFGYEYCKEAILKRYKDEGHEALDEDEEFLKEPLDLSPAWYMTPAGVTYTFGGLKIPDYIWHSVDVYLPWETIREDIKESSLLDILANEDK